MTREEAISKLHELIECAIDRVMIDDICYEIIEFLEAQEPRVMTVEEIRERAEADDPDPVFVERKSGATAFDLYTIDIIYHMAKRPYMDIRVWTSRPSPEQMRDTPWEEDSDA